MTTIVTDLRNTRPSAREIIYEPNGGITATNVQDAITQAGSQPPVLIPTKVTFAMSPYTVKATDTLLLLDTAGGSITINLAASASRVLPLEVKDDTGHAATNPISLVPNGAETVDGLAPYPLDSNFIAIKIVPQAAGYYVDA